MRRFNSPDEIKAYYDCRQVIARDLGPPVSTSGGIWTFPCPFHDEKTVGGFKVYKDGYKCFSAACGAHGDVLDWQMYQHKQTFIQAYAALGGDASAPPPDPVEQARRAAERAERVAVELERKIEDAQKALQELRQAQSWLKYHDQMNEYHRHLWHARGLSDFFIDWWKLGFSPDYTLWRKDGEKWIDWWHSPTLSIPIWGEGWQVYNVKHRLLKEPPDGGKYHQEKKGVPAMPFFANPDVKSGPLFLAEGEIKSMVTFATLQDERLQVAGLPAATPEERVFGLFANYEPVYLCLDPDAYIRQKPDTPCAAERALNLLGRERVRIIRLPGKIDDMIVNYGLGADWVRDIMKTAKRIRK